MKTTLSTAVLTLAILSPLLNAESESERNQKIGSYEECAVSVFQKSKKVSDVFKECEAEMDAYTATYFNDNVKAREQLEHKVKVETRKALSESLNSENDK